MQINLGPCHYDGNRAATHTAVHPDRVGWIAVCGEHTGKAEQEGYRVNEAAGGADRAGGYGRDRDAYPREPDWPSPRENGPQTQETPRWRSLLDPKPGPGEAAEAADGGLDTLDELLDERDDGM